jgi:septum formation protein
VTFLPATSAPLWLASRSPRRRRLLAEAGVPVRVRPAEIDDGVLVPGAVSVAYWVAALAYLKGRWVADALLRAGEGCGTVLAADTVCVHDGCILGQPSSAAHARWMLQAMRDQTHETVTGLCLISLVDRRRWLLVDRAIVRFGLVGDEEIEAYVGSGEWRGKAGAYNLQDRVRAGWPVECRGDPATVMGLPMCRLRPWLTRLREESR